MRWRGVSTGWTFLLLALALWIARGTVFSAGPDFAQRPVFAGGPVRPSLAAVEPNAESPQSGAATDLDVPQRNAPQLDAAKGTDPNPAAANPDSTNLDDAVEPLVPKQPRSESDQDRLKAMALFAAARTNEQRQELPLALKQYERAPALR